MSVPRGQRVVLVTGGGGGIGGAVCEAFGKLGDTVFVNDVSSEATRERVGELARTGIDARPAVADVSDPVAVAELVEGCMSATGRLDVLVNCAALLGAEVIFDVLEMPEGLWERMVAVNLSGAFYCCREYLRRIGGLGGCIVNVSSVAGLVAEENAAAYSAVKAGLIGLTKGLALDFADRGVRANTVAPGWIDTEKSREVEHLVYRYPKTTPLGHGAPWDVAGAVVFLASDAARFVTGTTLVVDGGVTAY